MEDPDKRQLIAQAAAQIILEPVSSSLLGEEYTKVPWGRMAAMGSAFASMSEVFRTIPTEGLYRVDFHGVSGALAQAKDGSGALGTIINESGVAGQARWHEVPGVTLPIDPATLGMMVLLVQIGKKFDDIAAMQHEMLEYMKIHDRAQLKGDLNLMVDIMNDFKNCWNDEGYRKHEISRLKEIQRTAEQGIVRSQDLISGKLGSKPIFHFGWDVEGSKNELCELLGDYRLALSSYTFATFLLVLLEENYESGHLRAVLDALEDRSNAYRDFYTCCFNRIEEMADSSVESGVLKGLSFAGNALGAAIGETPLGDVSPVDEFLLDAAKQADSFGGDQKAAVTRGLLENRDGGVAPFVGAIRDIERLCNQSVDLLVGEDGVYFRQLAA